MKNAAVSVIVIACIALMFQYPRVMLNPGPLIKGHQKLRDDCAACHNPFQGIANGKCISCHKLSEIGKDTASLNSASTSQGKVLFHEHLSGQHCVSCHTDHKGIFPDKIFGSFKHEMLPGNYLENCKSCHAQPDNPLHRQLSPSCSNCHQTGGWKTAVAFSHDMITGETRDNCISCHQRPDDSFHQQSPDNCGKCHGSQGWKPSTFDHSAFFLLAGDHNAACSTCHNSSNFNNYTCYGCHEHSEGKIAEEHNEHGIYNFADCASCHRSGDEHDIRSGRTGERGINQEEVKNLREYGKSHEKDHHKKHHDEEKEHDD